jgi:hypothetical protein
MTFSTFNLDHCSLANLRFNLCLVIAQAHRDCHFLLYSSLPFIHLFFQSLTILSNVALALSQMLFRLSE